MKGPEFKDGMTTDILGTVPNRYSRMMSPERTAHGKFLRHRG